MIKGLHENPTPHVACSDTCVAFQLMKIAKATHRASCAAGPDGKQHIGEFTQYPGSTQVDTRAVQWLECWYPEKKRLRQGAEADQNSV